MLKKTVEEIRADLAEAKLPTRSEIERDIASDPDVQKPDKSFPYPDFVKLQAGGYAREKKKPLKIGIKLIRQAMRQPTFGSGPAGTKTKGTK